MISFEEIAERGDLLPGDPADAEIWDAEKFPPVNWENLAKQAGEPVAVSAWEAYFRTLPQYRDPEAEPSA